jgi:hypothetical protein
MGKQHRKYEQDNQLTLTGKHLCIICDVDGTLAHMNGRSPFADKFSHQDMPEISVMLVVNAMAKQYQDLRVIVLSGRSDVSREQTETFLQDYHVPYDYIFMRKAGDYRKDSIIKQEIYEEEIKPYFDVLFVLDDRKQVVDMWHELGLKVFQVAEGNF